MQLFFAENIESDIYTLSEEESKHCIRVLRMTEGDEIFLTDGRGTLCRCRISEAHPKRCTATVAERIKDYERHPFYLHVAIAPTKNSARLEWFVEKAVEMGVDEITPIVCDHSERVVVKQERLQKIAISAMKQSLKAFLPRVNEATPLAHLVDSAFNGQRFIAYCDGDMRTPLRDRYKTGDNALILIGPEGDFSPAEVTTALDAGFQPVTLGPCRLRTETAAVAAVAFFNLMN
jgi:16S rRNA (uracil1498-N3)-methyltransferase